MIKAEIEISNGGKLCLLRRGYLSEKEVNRVKLNADFEKGKFRLIISEDLRKELNLEIIDNRRLLQANKEDTFANVAEFIQLKFENRSTTIEPFVLPNISGAILGESILNDLDVLVHPREEKLVVNPKHPYVANKYLK